MELSAKALSNLSVAGDSAHIPDKIFSSLVTKACEGTVQIEQRNSVSEDPEFKGLNQAVLKEAYGGLVSMVIEAAKHDTDLTTLSTLLEDCKYTSDRIDTVNKIYQARKPYLQMMLGKVGTVLPNVVDVDWRLDYYIKSNHLEKVNEPIYLINLKAQVPGKPGLEDFQFSCSMEQLQDFVGKLKDSMKSMEKFAQ